jgi:hypothetical protein
MENEPISILVKTRNWQNLYGVRRSNFHAYRSFCQRRNKKIRKSLKISFGKKFSKEKFEVAFSKPKEIEKIDRAQAGRLIEAALLLAEKNYIVYLESKQSAAIMKKRVVKKKLRNSLRYIDGLLNNYSHFLANRSVLELTIYRSMVSATLYLEQKEFSKAKEEYLKLIAILKQLIDIAAAVEKAQLEELLDSAKQSLRYCKFQLKDFDNREERDAMVIRNYEDLQQLLEKVSETGTIGGRRISLFGSNLEIDDPKILAIFNKEDLLKASLQANLSVDGNEDVFWETVNNYEEGVRICHKNRVDAGNNASLGKIWNNLDNFFVFKKDLMLLKRNMKIFVAYEKKFDDQSNKKSEERRPQESIKQLETLLAHIRKLVEIYAKFEKQSPLLNLLESLLRSKKCFFICQLYYNNKCYKEALSLAENQVVQLQTIESTIRVQREKLDHELGEFEQEHSHGQELNFAQLSSGSFSEVNNLYKRLLLLIKQTKVGLFDEGQIKMAQLEEDLEGLELKRPFDKSRNINCLLDLVIENRESTVKEQMDFIKIPPVAQLISNKPIFLDMVWNFVDYPELPQALIDEEKKQQPAKKGFFGSLFGKR